MENWEETPHAALITEVWSIGSMRPKHAAIYEKGRHRSSSCDAAFRFNKKISRGGNKRTTTH